MLTGNFKTIRLFPQIRPNGFLALCVGLFFAYPVIWLSWMVAYRWMQYGHRAAMDQPGTQSPMLASL